MTLKHPGLFIVIVAMFMLTQFSASLYLPALMHIQQAYQISISATKLSLTVFFMGYAIGQLIWGTASDHFGRKRVVMTALALYIIVSGTLIWVDINYTVFLSQLAILGLTAAFGTSCGNAILKDIYGKEKLGRAISFVGIGMALAPTLSPVLGSYLTDLINWHGAFIFLCLYSIVLWWLLAILLPNDQHRQQDKDKAKTWDMIHFVLSQRNYIGFIVPLGLMFGFMFSYFQAAPYLFMGYAHLSLLDYGWVTFATTGAYLAGTLINSMVIDHTDARTMVALGLWVMLLAQSLLILLNHFNPHLSLVELIGGFLLAMLGLGLALPASKAGAMLSSPRYAGTASSWMKFTQVLLSVIITAICAKISVNQSVTTLLLSYSALVIFAQIWLYLWCRKHPALVKP